MSNSRSELTQFRAARDQGQMPFAEPGVSKHYAPSRTTRIEHMDLHLSLFPEAKRFEGEARIKLTPLLSYGGVVVLDLDEVEVDAVTDGAGAPLDYTHADGELRVKTDTPDEVVVRWHGANPRCGLYFTGPTAYEPERQHMAWTQCQDEDGHFLMPCHDHPGIRHTWTIHLEGPEGYTLISNGAQVSESVEDGRVHSHWVMEQTMPAYLFNAICAKLSVVESQWRGRPVRYLVPEGEEEAVVRSMGKTPLMIECFSQVTGFDYAWPRYDQIVVHDFIFGGMENTAATTMTDLLLVDEKAQLEWDPDGLVSHELAHQWFGDVVTCRDWSQGWLNESWATFLEAVWVEHDRSEAEATWYRFDTMGQYLQEASGRYTRPIVEYRFREPIDVFDRHLYQKGSCVLWTLRAELGEDVFWGGVKHYLHQHAHSAVHTQDFQRALEESTGVNLQGFMHQWIHAAGHPKLEVKLQVEDELLSVAVKQTQSADNGVEAYKLRLPIEVVYADGRTQRLALPVQSRDRAWAIPVSGEVDRVRVDPGLSVLAEVKIDGPVSLLGKLSHDVCPVLAVRACRALMNAGTPAAVKQVGEALTAHPFHAVREAAAGLFGKRGGQESEAVLRAAAASEVDPRVLRAIVEALGEFRTASAFDAIAAVLDNEPETWHLHGACLVALGKTRDVRAVERIRPHLECDSWAEVVRSRALAGLAATRDAAVLDTLLAHSTMDFNERVRAGAAAALTSLGKHVESTKKVIVERLVEMLSEPGFRVQNAAIAALGSLKAEDAAGALSQVHGSAPDGRTRRSAYEALYAVNRGAKDALGSVQSRLDALTDENAKLRARLDKLEGAPK